jgi:hypothetical protein
MASRLALEVGTASKLLDSELPVPVVGWRAPTHANALVDAAKRLQRAQSKRTRLKRELKAVEAEIKSCKKDMKALIAEIRGRG